MKTNTAEVIPFNPNELVAFTEFEQQLNKLEALGGLVKAGLSKEDAVKAVTAIAKHEVPNVTIGY